MLIGMIHMHGVGAQGAERSNRPCSASNGVLEEEFWLRCYLMGVLGCR